MARVTGRIIKEKYAPGKSSHSFYKEQTLEKNVADTYYNDRLESEILYYIDNNSVCLKMKNTLLLG